MIRSNPHLQLIRRLSLLILAFFMAITDTTAAYALSSADYSGQNVFFYSDEAATCSGTGTTLAGNGNIEKIYNFLIGKDLTSDQAGGILGNLRVEGGFSATRHEMGKAWEVGGYGIVQWTGGRRDALVKVIKEKDPTLMEYYKAEYGDGTSKDNGYVHKDLPVEVSDRFLNIELDFLYDESTHRNVRTDIETGATATNEWESVSKATSLRQASDIWYYNFERPQVQNETNAKERANAGEAALKEIGVSVGSSSTTGGTDTLSASAGSSCGTSNGDVSSLQALVKEYAYPKFMGHNYITPTKAYADAITAGAAQHLHIGGTKYPGIDCGGYVTLLMYNSGWDTTYNYNGKGGATGAKDIAGTQWKWLEDNWEKVNGTGHVTDTGDLQPGDVAIEDGHTWVFVGTIDGFSANQSSASWDNRAPMASEPAEQAKATKETTFWYRKKATATTEGVV